MKVIPATPRIEVPADVGGHPPDGLLGLMHLADSALPTGGFAFSSGVEAAAALRLFSDPQGFCAFVEGAVDQAWDCEAPFLAAFMVPADRELALAHFHAMAVVPAIRKASLVQGRGWLRLMDGIFPPSRRRDTGRFFRAHADRCHALAVLGMGLREAGFDAPDIRRLHLYMLVRDAVGAAIRLGVTGPMDGHRLQHELLSRCERLAAAAPRRTWRYARKSAALLEIAQACHEHLYTRLFQN